MTAQLQFSQMVQTGLLRWRYRAVLEMKAQDMDNKSHDSSTVMEADSIWWLGCCSYTAGEIVWKCSMVKQDK